jgi:hypothetical protein
MNFGGVAMTRCGSWNQMNRQNGRVRSGRAASQSSASSVMIAAE